jgi:hypothetical protein
MGLEKNSHVVRVGGEAVGGFSFLFGFGREEKSFSFWDVASTERPPWLGLDVVVGSRGGWGLGAAPMCAFSCALAS